MLDKTFDKRLHFFHIALMLSPYHGTNAATEQSFTTIIMFPARKMLELGRSQSWTRALETISGDRRMDARPLLDYFKKLHEWLREENKKYSRTVGWKTETEPCKYEITKNTNIFAAPLWRFWVYHF